MKYRVFGNYRTTFYVDVEVPDGSGMDAVFDAADDAMASGEEIWFDNAEPYYSGVYELDDHNSEDMDSYMSVDDDGVVTKDGFVVYDPYDRSK